MKINHDVRVGMDKIRNETITASTTTNQFAQYVVQQEKKLQREQLHRLMMEIDEVGERLSRSRNFKDLAKFKTLVKRFVREAVEFGMDLRQSHTFNQFGEGRRLNIVETIDEKLVELTETVLQKEKQSIDVLDQIGEIKGLLINLYT
ncbi:YaaR family protein [Aeribacillus pallidus]|jgi:uncharacterized protein|uniref:YaaR family protein n=1 Tax=Aeribacillus pallidus TaxID=33936 RepID=UPI001D6214A7|nr:YaaR family protein [Bacillus sp. (in: firmicutes)]